MSRLKRVIRRFFRPPAWLGVPFAVLAFAQVIRVLAQGHTAGAQAYLSYGASAYALAVALGYIPGVVQAFRSGFEGQPLLRRMVRSRQSERLRHDAAYRTELSLYAGLAVNLAYVAVKLACGFIYQSQWFAMLAGYYLLLAIMRFALLSYVCRRPVGRNMADEWRRYRLCGVMLLVMNPALAVIVNRMLSRGDGFVYPGVLIYAMATYTFYMIVQAVINVVKYRRSGSPVLSAAKAVNLAAAMTSMLALETAMLAQFAEEKDAAFSRMMIALSGFAVCMAVLIMAVCMIARACRELAAIDSSGSI